LDGICNFDGVMARGISEFLYDGWLYPSTSRRGARGRRDPIDARSASFEELASIDVLAAAIGK
jgi:hypothetical protein